MNKKLIKDFKKASMIFLKKYPNKDYKKWIKTIIKYLDGKGPGQSKSWMDRRERAMLDDALLRILGGVYYSYYGKNFKKDLRKCLKEFINHWH